MNDKTVPMAKNAGVSTSVRTFATTAQPVDTHLTTLQADLPPWAQARIKRLAATMEACSEIEVITRALALAERVYTAAGEGPLFYYRPDGTLVEIHLH